MPVSRRTVDRSGLPQIRRAVRALNSELSKEGASCALLIQTDSAAASSRRRCVRLVWATKVPGDWQIEGFALGPAFQTPGYVSAWLAGFIEARLCYRPVDEP